MVLIRVWESEPSEEIEFAVVQKFVELLWWV